MSTNPATSVKIFELLDALNNLKHLKRTGWVKCGVPEPETVACHMYRMAVLAMSLEGLVPQLDCQRAVRMALVHDIGEAIIGDITPHCGVTEAEKQRLEAEAVQKIAVYVPALETEIVELWWEYEKRADLTARVVHHLDKFDMIVQAEAYEKKYGIDLEQFFTSTAGCFTLEPFVSWDKQLREQRAERRDSEKYN